MCVCERSWCSIQFLNQSGRVRKMGLERGAENIAHREE